MKSFFNDYDFTQLLDQILAWIINILPGILLIILLGFISLRLWKLFIRKTSTLLSERAAKLTDEDAEESGKRINTLMGIIKVAGRLAIWGITIMLLLQKLNISIGPLLAGLGIFGLAVGFGAQELVRDVVSGFFILLENHIRKGDVAVINGTGGVVENISIRTTTLRDVSGVVHIFQNGKINSLSNMTMEWSAKVFDVGIAYKENTDIVVEIMKRIGTELQEDPGYEDLIINPLEIFGVDSFGDNAVVIKARMKTKPMQQWFVGREFNRRLKMAFDKEGIEIPFPQRTITLGKGVGEMLGKK